MTRNPYLTAASSPAGSSRPSGPFGMATNRPAVGQVELPVAPTRGQQHRAVADIADRLPVGLAGLAPGEEHQHEPAAEWGGNAARARHAPARSAPGTRAAGCVCREDGWFAWP